MFRSGSKLCCPSCGVRHIVRPDEIGREGGVEVLCASCGTTVSIVGQPADIRHLTIALREASSPERMADT